MGGVCRMVQKQVLRTSEKCIYRIQESNLDFYMIIPNSVEVSLVLGLVKSVNDDVVSKFSFVKDKAVVIPVLDERILNGIEMRQSQFFQYLDKYFSNLLNLAHKILTHNRLKVLDMVYFYSSLEYKIFKEWFIQNHNGRVQSIDLYFEGVVYVEQKQKDPSSPVFTSNVESNPFLEASRTEDTSVSNTNKVEENEVVSTQTKEPGFVSYVLLGVFVAILSLVFLYFII